MQVLTKVASQLLGRTGLLWTSFSGLLQPPCITSNSVHTPESRKNPTQKGSACPALPQPLQSQSYDDSVTRSLEANDLFHHSVGYLLR